MKKSMKKLIEVLLSLALVAQFAVPMTALADGEETTSARYSADFSTDVGLVRAGAYEGVFQQYLKGQYGKGKDDTSVRVYTLGKAPAYGNVYKLTDYFPAVVAEPGKVGHISFEYLLEDANSAIEVYVADKIKDGALTKEQRVLQIQPNYIDQVYMFTATGSYRVGTWAKADIYFNYGETGATIFHNGTKYELDDADLSAFAQINAFDIRHVHTVNGETINPSAIQFDNFVCETVDSIPDAQEDYRYLGEMFNFEDGFTHSLTTSESDSTSKYMIANNGKAVARVGWNGKPAVRFNGTGTTLSFEKGIGGNPVWDTSAHLAATSSAKGSVNYFPGIQDLKAGDYGHLTFRIMDNTPQSWGNLVSNYSDDNGTTSMKFSDGTELRAHPIIQFVKSTAEYKTLQFFTEKTDFKAYNGQWNKFDIIYKVGNGVDTYTKVDCYVNGVLALEDYELIPTNGNYDAILNHIGQVTMAQQTNRNVYVDDFGFGVFTAETLHNPTVGYTLSATNDVLLNSCINNTTREIAISEGYKVEYFLAGVDQTDSVNVSVYNADGLLVTEGLMEGCSVKVSNGFGAGIWYNVVDKMVVAEDNFTKRLDGNKTTNVFGSLYSVGVSRDGVGGLGGKAADDLALELIEANASSKDHLGRPYFASSTDWKSNTVILEGSFMLKNADSSLELTIAPNGLSYGGNAQYLMQFSGNGMMRSMYRNTLDEQWQPNRWYKIAAVMNYHSKTIQVYLNGDIIWDGPYTTLNADGEAEFGEEGAGFVKLSQVRVTFTGEAAMDNIRVSYGQYDPTADKITAEVNEAGAEFFSVNNEENLIGFAALGEEGHGITGADVIGCFDEENIKIYTDSTLTTDAAGEEVADNNIIVISKGEVLKYFELGYVTNKLLSPTISSADGTLTATAPYVKSASKNSDSQAVLLLAVYNGDTLEAVNLEDIESVTNLTAAETTTLTGIDMTGKVAKAFLWDGMGTMKPMSIAIEYTLPVEEVPGE